MAPRVGEGVERMDVPCGIWGNCVEFVATLISFQAECSLLVLTWTRELPAPPLILQTLGFSMAFLPSQAGCCGEVGQVLLLSGIERIMNHQGGPVMKTGS